MDKIKVLVKRVGENPEVISIENHYKEMQKLVGGYMQLVPYYPEPVSKEVACFCNEEGKLEGLEPNYSIPGDIIVGDVFFSRTDAEGDQVSLTDKDIQDIEKAYGWVTAP